MTEISTNYEHMNVPPINPSIEPKKVNQVPSSANRVTVDEFWRREKRKNTGLVERLYNKIKNATGIGTGSKKVEVALKDLKAGNITQEEFAKKIKNYNSSQETSAQLFGDSISIGASALTYFGLNKAFKYTNAACDINKSLVDKAKEELSNSKNELEKDAISKWGKRIINFSESILNTLSSKKRLTAISIAFAGLTGGFSKYFLLKFNRINSDEFKIDKQIYGSKKSRNEYTKLLAKGSKKKLKKERHRTNFKNFISGAINGVTMPIMALGGIAGAPIYLVTNSLNRYFVASKTDKNKTIDGYINNLTNDGIATGIVTAAMAIPLVKKGNYTKTFNENIAKATKKLADVKLKDAEYGGISAYKKLETELLNSSKVKAILEDTSLSVEKQVQKLIDENIFAAKFKQIADDGTELCNTLKQNCPTTRTLKEAQAFVDKNLGNGYKLTKLLGVGTVAETYFAKSPEGKEVCIKILKEGISREKVLEDKEKFVSIVKNMKDKSNDEIDYLLRNVDDLAEGILKEVDLQNEMNAAKRLAPFTKVANVVNPITVKNNVYVMERAKGVSLDSFMALNRLYIAKEAAEKLNKRDSKKAIEMIEKEIEAVQSRMPGFDDIKLRKQDVNYLLTEYQKVFIEQFHKINKNGKIMHGDLHPGNIFIDPQVLRTKRGKLFTLIDTGNTIEMSTEQSLRALNFTKYVKQGNVQDIAAFVLDGAKLPSGMTEKEALEKVSNELKKCFFDSETKLGQVNDESVLTITDNIMQKFNIIPNSTQLNLNKSRTSARNSLSALKNAIAALDSIDVLAEFADGKKVKSGLKGGKKVTEHLIKNKIYNGMISAQEKQNLRQLSKAEQRKQKHNPSAPKTNSEDYITYKLKQYKFELDDV